MLKPRSSRRILYLLFDAGPSATVRARVFENLYRCHGYGVRYLRVYCPLLARLLGALDRHPTLASFRYPVLALQRVFRLALQQWVLVVGRRYDAVVVLKWATPTFLLRLRRWCGTPILYDFDDALWLDAFLGEQRFARLVTEADFVSCDNDILADHARRYNTNVSVVEGPPQVESFARTRAARRRSESSRIVLGWVGGPTTLYYLYAILDALELVAARVPGLELVLLGTGRDGTRVPPFERISVQCVPYYDQGTMLQMVPRFDVGLFPLFDNEMSRGRGALKAKVYLSAGVPVVVSPIGENLRVVRHGVTGFLARTTDEWVQALTTLASDSAMRVRMGEEGQREMKARCSADSSFAQLEHAFLSRLR